MMTVARITIAAVWMTVSTAVVAQTGGYPASPSHGIVGAPRPDGSLQYGSEPGKKTDSSSDTANGNRTNTDDDPGKDNGSAAANTRTDKSGERTGSAGGR
jgi:hypothetical protein